jgi:AcrR family transcriptional regulator
MVQNSIRATKKNDRVRADILRAAEKVFRQWGMTKTTMEDIAREAGKGKSTLYYYFKSKDEVLDAMAETQLDRIIGLARQEVAEKKSAKEGLIAYMFTMFREIQRVMAPLNIERDMATVRAVVDRVVEKFDAKNEKMIAPILRSGIESGEFKTIGPRDLKATTRAIAVVIRSLAFNLFIDNRDKRLIDLVIRLLSEGL